MTAAALFVIGVGLGAPAAYYLVDRVGWWACVGLLVMWGMGNALMQKAMRA